MVEEERNFEIPEDFWPTEVTPVNLAKIAELRNQEVSLVEAVARVITEEATGLVPRLTRRPKNHLSLYRELSLFARSVFNIQYSYMQSSLALISAEEFREKGQPVSLVEVLPESLKQVIDIQNKIAQVFSYPEILVEEEEVLGEANWYVLQGGLAQQLVRTEDPLLVYDDINNKLHAAFIKSGRDRIEIEALLRGRERFHQLSKAAQEVTHT